MVCVGDDFGEVAPREKFVSFFVFCFFFRIGFLFKMPVGNFVFQTKINNQYLITFVGGWNLYIGVTMNENNSGYYYYVKYRGRRRISYPFVEEPKEREKQNDDDVVDDERFGVGVFWVIHFSNLPPGRISKRSIQK